MIRECITDARLSEEFNAKQFCKRSTCFGHITAFSKHTANQIVKPFFYQFLHTMQIHAKID